MKDNYINWTVKKNDKKWELKGKDLELLKLIGFDSRVQLSELAKKMKLSKVAVFNRIKNLERKEIITGYSCLIDFSKLGFKIYQIGIKSSLSMKEKESYLLRIGKLNFVSQILKLSNGKWDFLVRIISNGERLDGDLDGLSDSSIQTLDVMEVDKIYFERNREIEEIDFGKEEKITSNEMKLLYELARNSKQKIIDLAVKLKNTPKTVISMIKKLRERKVIISLPTQFNPFVYGNEAYLLVVSTRKRSVRKELVSKLVRKKSTGALVNYQNPDIISFHVVSDLGDLKDLEDIIRARIDEIISYEFIKIEEQSLYHFFPDVVK